MALLMYLATSLFIWLFTLPVMGLFDPNRFTEIVTGPALESHLEYARNQAIQRQRPVTVCASDNGRDCSGSSQWKAGWIVFTDSDRNPGQFNPDDELLCAYVGESQRPTLEINVKLCQIFREWCH